jgi:membrane fusion protein (multidrug efflux system)
MALPFSRSLRALDDEPRFFIRSFGLAVTLLACAWCIWFFRGRVRVTVSVANARIEAAQVGHPLQAPVGGYLIRVLGQLGARVHEGDVVFELDGSTEEREHNKNLTEQRALQAQTAALKQEIRAVESALAAQSDATQVYVAEAELRKREAEELARFREEQRSQKLDLANAGLLSQADLAQSTADATQQRTEAETRAVAAERIRADQHVSRAERMEKLASLRGDTASLEGKLLTLGTELAEIDYRREQRRVRAPVDGSLGEMVPVTVGSFVHQGDTLGTVIPGGDLRIVANLPPEDAFGRVHAGQRARMRLAGFPWTQYGALTARVTRVAEEVRDGLVRVELAIIESRVPLQHGLNGSIEIEIERAAPSALLWRASGRALTQHRVEPESS